VRRAAEPGEWLACRLSHNVERIAGEALRWQDRLATGRRLDDAERAAWAAFCDRARSWASPPDPGGGVLPLFMSVYPPYGERVYEPETGQELRAFARQMLGRSSDPDNPFYDPAFLARVLAPDGPADGEGPPARS